MSEEPTQTADDLPEQMRVRREKLDRLVESGVQAYPVGVARTSAIKPIREAHDGIAAETETGEVVSIAGRVVARRDGGKLCFATLKDGTGEIQIMLSLAGVGEARLDAWKRDVDLGDHVSVTGEVIASKRGELSIMASEWSMASKALRPLPDKWHGLTDPETRVRRRYVDLIVNPEARRLFDARAIVLKSMRSTLDAFGFVEAETPILQSQHGGATARPFKTHLNAFDIPMSLRIALELPLKKLVVGGIDRVYEIGRNFRNEGVDTTHNPEFTMLEAYEAYGDYNTLAVLTRAIVVDAATALGVTTVSASNGDSIDLTAPWRRASVYELISEAAGRSVTVDTGEPELRALADKHGVALREDWSAGDIVLELYEKLVEHDLIQPTFVMDYPSEVRPLARQHRDDPRLAEAWDLVINGVELAPAYSELVDPVEQRRRLVEQSRKAAGGDPEAMSLDEDFLAALEQGAPPMGGLGLGVDRLLMLLTGANIREAITFPLLRPE